MVANTIIDGNAADSVVTFAGSETSNCILSGFTITNGYAGVGGGINGNGTYATIRYNVKMTNVASNSGGGIFYCYGTIEQNKIIGNLANSEGGGLACCYGTIQNNTIIGNSANNGGTFLLQWHHTEQYHLA